MVGARLVSSQPFRYASNVYRLYTSARLSLLALSMPSVMHLYSAAASRALAGESGSLSSILATLTVAIRTASRLSPRLIASSIDLARSSILAFLSCGSGGGTLLPIMKSGRFLRPPLGGRKALGRGGGPRVRSERPPTSRTAFGMNIKKFIECPGIRCLGAVLPPCCKWGVWTPGDARRPRITALRLGQRANGKAPCCPPLRSRAHQHAHPPTVRPTECPLSSWSVGREWCRSTDLLPRGALSRSVKPS